jgi:hypothetical protein
MNLKEKKLIIFQHLWNYYLNAVRFMNLIRDGKKI